jgi:hypothetical protein
MSAAARNASFVIAIVIALVVLLALWNLSSPSPTLHVEYARSTIDADGHKMAEFAIRNIGRRRVGFRPGSVEVKTNAAWPVRMLPDRVGYFRTLLPGHEKTFMIEVPTACGSWRVPILCEAWPGRIAKQINAILRIPRRTFVVITPEMQSSPNQTLQPTRPSLDVSNDP